MLKREVETKRPVVKLEGYDRMGNRIEPRGAPSAAAMIVMTHGAYWFAVLGWCAWEAWL